MDVTVIVLIISKGKNFNRHMTFKWVVIDKSGRLRYDVAGDWQEFQFVFLLILVMNDACLIVRGCRPHYERHPSLILNIMA